MGTWLLTDQETIANLIITQISEALNKLNGEPQDKQFFSQQELAEVLGLSVPTLIKLRKDGKISGVSIGNKWRYELSEVWEQLKKSSLNPDQK